MTMSSRTSRTTTSVAFLSAAARAAAMARAFDEFRALPGRSVSRY